MLLSVILVEYLEHFERLLQVTHGLAVVENASRALCRQLAVMQRLLQVD